MAKIFISAFSGNIDENNKYALPCFTDSFLFELKKLGNEILFFSSSRFNFPDNCPVPESVIEKIRTFSPDLIILFNNCFYDYDFSQNFDCPVIVLEVDSCFLFSNKNILKNTKNNYLYFVQANDSIKNINQYLGVTKKRIHRIPLFTSVQSNNTLPNTNISFIGTFFNYTSTIKDFMLSNPSREDIDEFYKICDYIKLNPFATKDEIYANIDLKTTYWNNEKNLNPKLIGFFLCSSERIKMLSAIADLGLDLYGTMSWITDFNYYPEIALNFKQKRVYSLEHNQAIYNQSKIAISIAHIQAKSGFPLRIMDVMASNACLVSDYHSDFDLYFPNIKIPTFKTALDAKEVCKYLLQNENERKEISLEQQNIINKNYRFDKYQSAIEEITGVILRGEKNNTGKIEFIFEPTIIQEKKSPNFKNKIQYKIWKHLGKKLQKKGTLQ